MIKKTFHHSNIPLSQRTGFSIKIWHYYHKHKRPFPWRETREPYHIMVSEIMLQQTQTDRVVPKYITFLNNFPDWQSLAKAPFHHVLKLWKGLGYNRRARFLQQSAQTIIDEYQGQLPENYSELVKLPGIGEYTANALLAFICNKPVVVLETNIRTVYMYTFFKNQSKVPDSHLVPLIKQTINKKAPREWYYALMDYGAMLKKKGIKLNAKNPQYRKQAKFEGSNRQIRGKILEVLLAHGPLSVAQIATKNQAKKERIIFNLNNLIKEKLVTETKRKYAIVDI